MEGPASSYSGTDPHLLEGGERGQGWEPRSRPSTLLPLWGGSNNLQRAKVVNHGQLPRYRKVVKMISSYCPELPWEKDSPCGQKGTRRSLVVGQTTAQIVLSLPLHSPAPP